MLKIGYNAVWEGEPSLIPLNFSSPAVSAITDLYCRYSRYDLMWWSHKNTTPLLGDFNSKTQVKASPKLTFPRSSARARRIPGQSGKLFPWCEISAVRHGLFGPRMSWESYFLKESKCWHSKSVYSLERLQWHPLKSEFLTNRGRYHKMVLVHHRGIS